MTRLLAALALVLTLGAAIFVWRARGAPMLKLETAYQAVLLDNGQVYYGKIERIDSEYTVLSDVYYVQSQAEPQSKEVKNVLIRRGSEWHAPNRSLISTRHVVMIEPVTSNSKVADLIAALSKNH